MSNNPSMNTTQSIGQRLCSIANGSLIESKKKIEDYFYSVLIPLLENEARKGMFNVSIDGRFSQCDYIKSNVIAIKDLCDLNELDFNRTCSGIEEHFTISWKL